MRFNSPLFSLKKTTLLSLGLYASFAITSAEAAAETMAECDNTYNIAMVQCQTDADNAPTWDDEFDDCLINTCGTKSPTHTCVRQYSTQVDCSDTAAEHVDEAAMAQTECEDDAAVAWGECSVEIEALTAEEELNEIVDDLLDDGLSDIDENGDVWGGLT